MGTSHRRISSHSGVIRASSQDRIQTVRNPQTSKQTVIHSHAQNTSGTPLRKALVQSEKPTDHQHIKQKAVSTTSHHIHPTVVHQSSISSGIHHDNAHTTNIRRDGTHTHDLPV